MDFTLNRTCPIFYEYTYTINYNSNKLIYLKNIERNPFSVRSAGCTDGQTDVRRDSADTISPTLKIAGHTNHVVGTHQKRLIEAFLMGPKNTFFTMEN